MTLLRHSVRRAVVTGASGMLGGQVLRLLLQAGVDAEGWSYGTAMAPDGIRFTTLNNQVAERRLRDSGVDLVIHCAALTDADAMETGVESISYARRINGQLPGQLAKAAKELGARFIHVSTDAVYDGSVPGRLCRETDIPHPISVYARTKLEGEHQVLEAYPDATVVRTTMVGWTLPGKREKFAEAILRALIEGKPIKLFTDAVFSPLHVRDLADLLIGLDGVWCPGALNLGACDAISKADFGYLMADVFDLDPSPIQGVLVEDVPLVAARTKNTALDVRRALELLSFLPSVWQGIELLYQDYRNGTVERLKGGPWPTTRSTT